MPVPVPVPSAVPTPVTTAGRAAAAPVLLVALLTLLVATGSALGAPLAGGPGAGAPPPGGPRADAPAASPGPTSPTSGPTPDPSGSPPRAAATLALASVTPVLRRGGRLVVDGTVRNTGALPLTAVQAYLRYLRQPVTIRAGLAEAFDSAAPILGATLLTSRYADLSASFEPGATVAVHLDVAVADLGVSEGGAYPVDVEIRATLPDGSRSAVATERTVLPLVPAGRRVPMTVLVPLVDRPHRLSRTVFVDDDLAASLAPTGRLGRVLAAASPGTGALARPQLVLDPMLLDEATALAGGYRVLAPGSAERTGTSAALPAPTAVPAPPGTTGVPARATAPTAVSGPLADADLPSLPTRPGGGAAVAAAWLSRLRTAAAGTTVLLLPWGNPDPGSTPPAVLRATVERGVAVAGAAGLTTRPLTWPSTDASGTLDPAGLTGAATTAGTAQGGAGKAAAALVLVSSATTTPALADPATTPLRPLVEDSRAAGAPLIAIRADATLDRVLGAAGSTLARRQRLLAETAVFAMAATSPLPVLVCLPPTWDPALLPTPVLSPAPSGDDWTVPAPDVTRQAPGGPVTVRTGVPDPATRIAPDPGTTLTTADPRQSRQAAGLTRGVAALATILTEPTAVTAGFAVAGAQLLSRQWSGNDAAYDRFGTAVAGVLDGLTGAVSVPAARSVALSSGDGRFPITVTNRLRQRVRVSLLLHSENALRLDIAAPNPRVVVVAPADSTTVSVRAAARSNGQTRVTATVTTPGGVPLGPSRPFQVTAQHYDTVGWVVIGVALTLLFGATGLRIVRRIRARIAAA